MSLLNGDPLKDDEDDFPEEDPYGPGEEILDGGSEQLLEQLEDEEEDAFFLDDEED